MVVVCYSRGEINDKYLIGMETQIDGGQVDSGRMNYHNIQILPTNENILKRGDQFNTKMNELKFKVGDHLQFQYPKFGNYS